MSEKIEVWDDLKGIHDLDGTLREGSRKEFVSVLGKSEPLFCASCHRPCGYVSIGSPAARVCPVCETTYGGLPLPETPNVSVFCKLCGSNPCSVPRELVDKFVTGDLIYYCDPCEVLLENPPPLPKMSHNQESKLGIVR